MKKKKMILILVLLLTIGFASVSTTLVMNGVIGISNKKEDFNVIFTSATINGNNEAKVTISENKKTINFETNKLSIVGDSAELIYKVKNNSTQYDANVTISCTGGNEEYLNIESEFAGKTLPLATPEFMEAQEVRMGYIRAELKKAYVGEDKSIPITCKIEVEGEERDSIQDYVEDKYTETLLNGTDPVIKEGLIPVTIEDDGTVKKADTTSEWYSYENKRWANAVILEENKVTTIKDSSGKENDGTVYGNLKEGYGYVSINDPGDYIDSVKTDLFTNTNNYAIALKFKYQNNGGRQTLFVGDAVHMYIERDGNFIISFGYATVSGSKSYITLVVPSDYFEENKIYNFIMNRNENIVKLYNDGEVIGETKINVKLTPNINYIKIAGSDYYSNGKYYYVAVSTKSLTYEEIQNYYKNSELEDKTNLLFEYKFFDAYNENINTIPEENIESYFVWIPKYKYKLWNVESTTNSANKGKHSIEIEFGTGNTENVEGVSCVTPMTSGGTGECNNGEYMTHPAFISMNTNGIWVGKFETTGSTSNVTVKPNITSLKNLNVKNMFDVSYNYQRTLDSHMMKNTEWGAVAYLSHSKYGIDSEININNNSNYLTGYSAVEGTDQSSYPGTYGTDSTKTLPYNTETGYKASTTGNISGIYDMSGGAHEYMASYMSGQIGASEFSDVTNPTYEKYLDVYSASSAIQAYQYRILGDATGEMGPFSTYKDRDGNSRHHNGWYADHSNFVDSSRPWSVRGGLCSDGVISGQFNFDRSTGFTMPYIGFRLVLA